MKQEINVSVKFTEKLKKKIDEDIATGQREENMSDWIRAAAKLYLKKRP